MNSCQFSLDQQQFLVYPQISDSDCSMNQEPFSQVTWKTLLVYHAICKHIGKSVDILLEHIDIHSESPGKFIDLFELQTICKELVDMEWIFRTTVNPDTYRASCFILEAMIRLTKSHVNHANLLLWMHTLNKDVTCKKRFATIHLLSYLHSSTSELVKTLQQTVVDKTEFRFSECVGLLKPYVGTKDDVQGLELHMIQHNCDDEWGLSIVNRSTSG